MKHTFEARHRERKRKAEMEIIIEKLAPFVKDVDRPRILEFGSGDGYQIPYLKKLGSLVASDLYKNERVDKYEDAEFVVCDIRNTPFMPNSFDIIFSNHVLEHIEDIQSAFKELRRIGKSRCIYAFAVPTNTWLLLSVPAQCHNALQRLFNKNFKEGSGDIGRRRQARTDFTRLKGWRKFMPIGHGWRKDFFACFNSFKVKNWQRLFCESGFEIMESAPLLLYAPSEFPVIPTTKLLADRGLYSSAIFIMKKSA